MKVCDLLFTKLNSYANRLIIKKVNTFDDVIDEFNPENAVLEDVNFHQGDGINAEQVVNIDFEDFSFDYLFVAYSDDDDKKVVSRWYVIGKNDNRRGQTNVSLKRDLISDYLDEVVKSPFMMERGNLDFGSQGPTSSSRRTDPLVFLKEEQQYNQIKKAQHLLYRYGRDFEDEDGNEPAWIVGYVPKNIKGYQTVEIQELGIGQNYGRIWGMYFDEDGIQNNRSDAFNVLAMPLKDCSFYKSVGNQFYHQKRDVSIAIMTALAAKGLIYDLQVVPYLPKMADVQGTGLYWNKTADTLDMSAFNYASAKTGPYDHVQFMEYGIYKGNYPGNVQCTHSASDIKAVLPVDWPASGTLIEVVFVSDTGQNSVSDWNIWTGTTEYSLVNNRYVFVSGTDYNYDSGTRTITFVSPNLKDDLFKMMDQGLAHLEIVYKQGTAPSTDGVQNVFPGIVSLAYSNDEFNVEIDSAGTNVDTAIQRDDLKLSANTDLYRLVSPNQEGIFEWSPAMNSVTRQIGVNTTRFYCGWNRYKVAVSLKPFNPYIRVCPDFEYDNQGVGSYFKSLYGENFKDGRGLICQGDFSLTMPSNAWQTYQLNNKTYASAFSREISTLEKKNAFGIANDIMGAVGSTAGGAVAGGLKGGIPGAVAGAVVGLTTGTYKAIQGGILRRDAIDKAKADFNMSLQSIQARPDSLTKVSALDQDNKIWPYVEVYSATDEEKELFESRLCIEGMKAHKKTTIYRQMVGVTVNYPYEPEGPGVVNQVYQFFSGTILKMENSTATPEMINEINNELATGVYFNVNNF